MLATPEPTQTRLQAGPFNMVYENGFIRYIRYGDNEVIRMLYMAVRDKNWGTYTPIIENEKIETQDGSFFISYTCRYEENGSTLFSWTVFIAGDETGKLIFTIDGKALQPFLKNRAGFCILHPIKNTAGQPLTITNANNTTEQTTFPLTIAAKNPFTNISKLQWLNEHEYCIEFKGDEFEMEDHRNWTDTSFKTFCTPLFHPFPVELRAEQRVHQQLIFYPVTPLKAINTNSQKEIITITVEEALQPLPAIGLGASTEMDVLPEAVIEAIKEVSPDFYTIDIKTGTSNWQQHVCDAIHTAQQLDTRLFISIECTDVFKTELDTLASLIKDTISHIQYLLVLEKEQPVTGQLLIEWLEENKEQLFPGIQTGIGTATNFAELNRNHRTVTNLDFVAYAIHPQEHAFDNRSLIENLEAQADTILSARKIYPGINSCVQPVTLRRRRNPYANSAADREMTNEQKTDPRQPSQWAAGWTLGSIKYLAEAGAAAVTYYQTVGNQGICSAEGKLYPAGDLLKQLAAYKKYSVQKTICSRPLQCSSLLLTDGTNKHLFLANYTGEIIQVQLPSNDTTKLRPYEVRKLNHKEH
jgi:D-apionolactonase